MKKQNRVLLTVLSALSLASLMAIFNPHPTILWSGEVGQKVIRQEAALIEAANQPGFLIAIETTTNERGLTVHYICKDDYPRGTHLHQMVCNNQISFPRNLRVAGK